MTTRTREVGAKKQGKPRDIDDLVDDGRPCFAICAGKHCAKAGVKKIIAAAEAALADADLEGSFPLRLTKCQDYCDDGPVATVLPGEYPYVDLSPSDVREIVEIHLGMGRPVRSLLHKRARRRLEKKEKKRN